MKTCVMYKSLFNIGDKIKRIYGTFSNGINANCLENCKILDIKFDSNHKDNTYFVSEACSPIHFDESPQFIYTIECDCSTTGKTRDRQIIEVIDLDIDGWEEQ